MENISPRLQYLIDHYGVQLSEHLNGHDGIGYEPGEAVLAFSEADPSRNKSATQWLIKTYVNEGFRFEDIADKRESKVFDTLAMFGLYRAKLSIEQRDINQYTTLSSIWKSVEPYVMEARRRAQEAEEHKLEGLEGRALRRAEKEKAHSESQILIDEPDGFKIVVPLTEFASCWWGRGTRWCTAAEQHNYFAYYYQKAPLYIVIMPNGEKVQLFADENTYQFMDSGDRELSTAYLEENWKALGPLVLTLMKTNKNLFTKLPQQALTQELCREMIFSHPDLLFAVPDHLRDFDMCCHVLEKAKISVDTYIPKAFFAEPQYQGLLKEKPFLLKSFPTQYWNKTNIKEALSAGADIAHKIPQHYFDKVISEMIIRNEPENFRYIPEEFCDKEMCELAVSLSGFELNKVPSRLVSDKLIMMALKEDPQAILFFQVEGNYSLKNLKKSIMANPKCAEYIPDYILRLHYDTLYPVFLHSLEVSQYQDMSMPRTFAKKEAYMILASRGNEDIHYDLPFDMQEDPDIWMEFLKNGKQVYRSIPKYVWTQEICVTALAYANMTPIHIPDEFLNEELFEKVIKLNPKALENLAGVQDYLGFVPDQLYLDTLLNAEYLSYRLMKVIPERILNQEVIDVLLAKKEKNYLYLPDRFVTKEYMESYIVKLQETNRTDEYLDNYLKKRFTDLQIQPLEGSQQSKCWSLEETDSIAEAYSDKLNENLVSF
jgi:hypothetical protein